MSSNPPRKMIFMGSDAIALPTLEWIAGNENAVRIVAVYTQPDRARGRGKQVQSNAIKTWALDKGLPVYQPEAFDEAVVRALVEQQADLILVMAYGHLLPQAILDAPPLGIYNLHTSLLPRLRGASPIETAVAAGLEESGVTLMKLVMKMDAGPVCDREVVSIDRLETGGRYREKLAMAGARLLDRNLAKLLDGSMEAKEQVKSEVSYCRLLVKQDGQLDFSQPASVLAKRINGLFPWPGCRAPLDGETIKIGLADWTPLAGEYQPGEVVACRVDGLVVGTGEGVLKLLKLQRPGGNMLSAGEFLRGKPIRPGARFVSREMHPLESRNPVSHKRVFQLYAKP